MGKRKNLSKFFRRHILLIKESSLCCEECGDLLIGDVSEVAHILPKSGYHEICDEDDNVLYLCSWMSEKNCHAQFDNHNKGLFSMKVFPAARNKVLQLIKSTGVKLKYKDYEKWRIK